MEHMIGTNPNSNFKGNWNAKSLFLTPMIKLIIIDYHENSNVVDIASYLIVPNKDEHYI